MAGFLYAITDLKFAGAWKSGPDAEAQPCVGCSPHVCPGKGL